MGSQRLQPSTMSAWLVRDEEVLASVTVLTGWGLVVSGARVPHNEVDPIVLRPGFWAQTFSTGYELDVAFLDRTGAVVRTARVKKNRIALPSLATRSLLRAQKGAFTSWGLKIGDVLQVQDCE